MKVDIVMDNELINTSKIELSKVQNMLEWLKTKLFLDSISSNAKKRIVRRGEVYLCNFGIGVGSEMQKLRPCVIIQSNVGNISSSNVIVAPITHTEKEIPSMAKIETQINLENKKTILNGYVNLSNIQTLSKKDIENVNKSILISLGLFKEIKQLNDKIKKQEMYIDKFKNI